MAIRRREALKLGLAAGATLLSPISFPKPALALLSPQIKRFCIPLHIPEALSPIRTDADTDYYEIKIQKSGQDIPVELQGGGSTTLKMEVWGYNGITPGPTIRQRGGDCIRGGGRYSVVRFINELSQNKQDANLNTVVHLHGMNALPCFDGYATDYIPPCHYKDFEYPNDCAGILWYHDHTLDHTARNVYMGLAGMYIIEDEHELSLGLPQGKYDIPLILQDRRFRSDGYLADFDDNFGRSLYGDMIFVNGTPWPKLEVERRKYRFRILNASVSRNYLLALSSVDRNTKLDQNGCEEQAGNDGVAFGGTTRDRLIVIGNDEGLLPRPVLVNSPQTLSVGVAERYDVIIDFGNYAAGDKVFLRSLGFTGTLDNDRRSHTLMRFDVVNGDADTSEIPSILREGEEEIPESKATQIRTFRFDRNEGKWKINNRLWDRTEISSLANTKLNAIEIWKFVNPGSGWVHPIHPHLLRFRILDRNGIPPQPYERGPKDVVMVGEFQTVRILARMCPHEGKYMIHCHNMVHEDGVMMSQFEIGENGISPHARPAKPWEEIQPMQPPELVSGFCDSSI